MFTNINGNVNKYHSNSTRASSENVEVQSTDTVVWVPPPENGTLSGESATGGYCVEIGSVTIFL